MNPSTINNCVLLLDLPQKALAGIDLLSFTTSPRFRGIKNLPLGLHFVFAANDTAFSVRQGAWFYVTPGTGSSQVFVKKWSAKDEELVAETAHEEVLRWKANLGSIWRDGLTPYRQTVEEGDTGEEEGWSEESTVWAQLTSHMTPTLLSQICGLSSDHWSLTSASSAAQDLEHIPGLEVDGGMLQPENELNLLPIDLKKTWRDGATGRERTVAAQDRSWLLGHIITNYCQTKQDGELAILGELQFVFLMVLTINNNSCLEQWKRLLELLLTCRQAITERPRLFQEFLKTLQAQLSHCTIVEGDLFDMGEAGGGFLQPLLNKFRKSFNEFHGKWKADLMDDLDDLQDFLQTEFDWKADGAFVTRGMLDLEDGERVEMDLNGADADDELGEYAPVVVELTAAQIKHLNGATVVSTNSASSHAADESEDDVDLEDMDMRY